MSGVHVAAVCTFMFTQQGSLVLFNGHKKEIHLNSANCGLCAHCAQENRQRMFSLAKYEQVV